MQITLFVQQSDWNLKITLPSKINSFVGIYNSQIKLHVSLKKAVNASYKRFRAKHHIAQKVSSLLTFHPFHPCKWWRVLDSWFPFSMHTTVKPCKNTAAACGARRTIILWFSYGTTSWISIFQLFRALFITSCWLVFHAVKISSNATDALIEDIRVEVLKFQMPSVKTYAEIKLSNEGLRVANLRNYLFMLLRVTADRSLKLTIRGIPQENLNNVILFPAFYPFHLPLELQPTPNTSCGKAREAYLLHTD